MSRDSAPSSLAGHGLGHYLLGDRLGAGGMGEVYRARDTRLGRDVAIKLLPFHFADDAGRRARFDREARLLAALNHPHIAAVYGLEEGRIGDQPVQGIVLELVDGQTLDDRLRLGPLRPDEAVPAALQIAQALEAAHERGIIHRDLKPANISLTPNGDVKILDFGIGRWITDDEPSGTGGTTLTIATEDGMVIGTPGYMSPEQVRGAAVDKRADVWAFGCVLYEMLTGRGPFAERTGPEAMAAVLHREPAWEALPAATPPSVRRLLRRCLEKDVRRRLRDIGDAASDLEDALKAPAARDQRPARRSRRWVGIAAVLVLGAGLVGWSLWSGTANRNPLAGATFTRLTDWEGSEQQAAISRDGRMVAFLADREGGWDAWSGQIDAGAFHNLTEGAAPELRNPAVRNLGFTPDGALITLWVRLTDPDRGVTTDGWTVPVLGGRLRPYMDRYADNIADGQWSNDLRLLTYHTSSAGDPLFVTTADGTARQIYIAEPGRHNHFPTWAPDGSFIYYVHGFAPDEMDVWRIRPEGGDPERLTFHESRVAFPTFVDDRQLLYLATAQDGSGPWIHVLDVERRVSTRISTGVDEYTSLDASLDGRRVVGTVSRMTATVWRAPLTAATIQESMAARVPLPTARGGSPRIGPGYMLYRSLTAGAESLWKITEGEDPIQLWDGREGRVVAGAAIAPGRRQIAFAVQRRGATRLHVMNEDASAPRRASDDLDVRGAPAWSPDGRWIAIAATTSAGEPALFKIPADGGEPQILVRGQARDPVWAPSGRFLVYSGADVGMTFRLEAVSADGEAYAIPDLTLSRGARRVAFLGDDRSLVVLEGDLTHKELWVVDLQTGSHRQLTSLGSHYTITDFDVSADGRELVFDRSRDESDIVLIQRPTDR